MSFYDEVMKATEDSSKRTNTSFSSSYFHVSEVRGSSGGRRERIMQILSSRTSEISY